MQCTLNALFFRAIVSTYTTSSHPKYKLGYKEYQDFLLFKGGLDFKKIHMYIIICFWICIILAYTATIL